MLHQVDEHILKPCVDSMPFIGAGAKCSHCRIEGTWIIATDVEAVSERDCLLDPWLLTKFHGQLMQVGAADLPRCEPRLLNHIGDRSSGKQLSV